MSFWSSRKRPLLFSHAVAYESSVVSDQFLLQPLFQISMVVAYIESLNCMYSYFSHQGTWHSQTQILAKTITSPNNWKGGRFVEKMSSKKYGGGMDIFWN